MVETVANIPRCSRCATYQLIIVTSLPKVIWEQGRVAKRSSGLGRAVSRYAGTWQLPVL